MQFPCGRQATKFEAKEVRLPLDITCDACVLELSWETEEGFQSFCSDIQITGGESAECIGGCQNGGICSNGQCSCTKQWSGSNCQFKTEIVGQKEGQARTPPQLGMADSGSFKLTPQVWFYLGMICLIIFLFAVGFFLYKKLEQRKLAQQQAAMANSKDRHGPGTITTGNIDRPNVNNASGFTGI